MIKNHLKPLTDEEMANLIEKHNKGGAFAKRISQNSCWDAGIKILPTCGHMTVPKYNVEFEELADEKIKKLQDYYPTLEWLAYLEGEVDHEKHNVLVTDIVIPDSQNVTGTNVYNVEYSWGDGRKIIGVIHSHHTMGAFFSGTDDAYINQNHDVSIVVSTNSRSPIKGQVRMKTLCGSYILAEDLTFSVKRKTVLDEKSFEKEFTSKINNHPNVRVSNTIKPRGVILLNSSSNNEDGGFNGYPPKVEEEYRLILSNYYSEEDVNEFIENGEAEEEVEILLSIEKDTEMIIDEQEWNSDDTEEFDTVSYGTAISSNDGEVWDLTEDDVIKEVLN